MRNNSGSRPSSRNSSPSSSPSELNEEESVVAKELPTPFSYSAYDEEAENGDDEDDDNDDDDETNLLEIMIETLTGTSFQVRVSPWETGSGLKDLLHRTQGIPSCHQHMLLGQKELTDESPLIDQGVQEGSVLKLILSMKGGPINSIRVPTQEDAIWKEFTSYMEMNREELWEGASGRQVTLLVLREGDDVNVYRVVENADGTFSPLNESWGSNSIISGRTDVSSDKETKAQDDATMHQRMIELRDQMKAMKLRKQEKKKKRAHYPTGKVSSPILESSFSAKGRRTRQNVPVSKRRNINRQFSELVEQDLTLSNSFTNRSLQTSIPEAGSVKPLKKMSSTKLSSRPNSSLQFSNRSDKLPQTPSHLLSNNNPPSLNSSIKMLAGRRSRPSTMEMGMDTRRQSLTKGPKVLEEIPYTIPPMQVDFSRRRRLESIRAQRERTHPLGPLNEDSINTSTNIPHLESYRKALAKYSRTDNDPTQEDNTMQREAWSRSEGPTPFYMGDTRIKRRHNRRLHQSHHGDSLRIAPIFDDRPKTSPEILARRPRSASTSSTMSDRIQLRGPDDRLKEIISILNSSRTDSIRGSPPTLITPELNFNKWHVEPNGLNTERSHPSERKSLSMSLASLHDSNSNPPSPAYEAPIISGKHRRDILREFARSQGVTITQATRKSTPDTFRRKARRPTSGRNSSTLNRFPHITPKKKKNAIQRPRCRQCHKKLGVSTTYSCRCGHVFCASHRYSETHDCTFDYKTEGKKFLQMTNPLVLPPKLPKI